MSRVLKQLPRSRIYFVPFEFRENSGSTGSNRIVIPDGRSLVKDRASFSSPRYVVGIRNFTRETDKDFFPHSFQGHAPTFLGYAPASNEIEVLSWNADKGEYDFLLVKDYTENHTAHIEVPDQRLCLSCHQQGGPIFSRNLWKESAVIGSQEFISKVKVDEALKDFLQLTGESLDRTVRFANDTLQANRVCKFSCGDDLKCRANLLKISLLKAKNSTIPSQVLQQLQLVLAKNWPRDNFSYPSDSLPDRNPLVDGAHGGQITKFEVTELNSLLAGLQKGQLSPFELTQITFDIQSGVPYSFTHATTDIADELTPGLRLQTLSYDDPSAQANPLFVRPMVSGIPVQYASRYLANRITDCFPYSHGDETYLGSISVERLEKIFNDDEAIEMVKKWPLSSSDVMFYARGKGPFPWSLSTESFSALFNGWAKKSADSKLFTDQNQTTPGALAPHSVTSGQANRDPFRVFQTYCGRCHYGKDAEVEDFEVRNNDDLLNFRPKSGRRFVDYILDGTMPEDRRFFDQNKKAAWEKDKSILIDFLPKAKSK